MTRPGHQVPGGDGLAVVTGASRGVGRATALAFATRGVPTVLLGRSADGLAETRRMCEDAGSWSQVVACDLKSPQLIDEAARSILELGPVRALVNNAGVMQRAPLSEITLASYRQQMDVNLLAPIWLTRALLEPMRRARQGRIVNVGSISSTLGSAGQIVYNASKWALVGFTKCLAEELSDSGLMTVAVLPGSIDTKMLIGSGFTPRMTAQDVASTLVHYSLDAPLAHNGAIIEMFGT